MCDRTSMQEWTAKAEVTNVPKPRATLKSPNSWTGNFVVRNLSDACARL